MLKVPGELSGAYSVKEGTSIICDSAFSGCRSLSEIVISDSVTSIGDGAFEGCRSLQKLSFPIVLQVLETVPFWGVAL